jgi:3-methyladenine DNA glycosylase AlkC
MPNTRVHPALRFAAPSTILHGTPLKTLIGPALLELLAESFEAAIPRFDAPRFRREAAKGLEPLGILDRGAHVGRALGAQLPGDPAKAARLVIASLGPRLERTEGNGLAVFFYLPHSCWIHDVGAADFDSGMRACYELTQRFTSEYCIRPFLERWPERSLKLLARWAEDPNPHVRRLVSEGTRPRLPWAERLRGFQADPKPLLPLLERLKDDPDLYVRRSVANHLGDLAKDHPALAFGICARWTEEAAGLPDPERRFWMIRHAVRLPARKGVREALQLRRKAAVR